MAASPTQPVLIEVNSDFMAHSVLYRDKEIKAFREKNVFVRC